MFDFTRSIWKFSQEVSFHKAWEISRANYLLKRNEIKARRQILEWAACLTPPSEFVMRAVRQNFGGSYRYFVIPHGIELWGTERTGEEFVRKYGLKHFVLCVSAGFNYRKNQLSLIRALKGTGLPLVIVATARTKGEERYFRKCQRTADSTTIFLSRLPQNMLESAYKAARVFALPSFFEAFGLVYFEAAGAGCNVVATSASPVKEILGNLAWYCDPFNIDSIRSAVLEAYNASRRKELQGHVLQNFTWERAAQLTLEVYRKVLNGKI